MAAGASKLFRCTVPHCGKFFNRKEHLRRHLKSHNPHPQHECPICGRRYARSDVLKRHIENHPQNPYPRQPRMPPCNACVERKERCNGTTPCNACTKASVECIRPQWLPDESDGVEVLVETDDGSTPEYPAGDSSNGASTVVSGCPLQAQQQGCPTTAAANLFASGGDNPGWLSADSTCPWPLLSFGNIGLPTPETNDGANSSSGNGSSNNQPGLQLYQNAGRNGHGDTHMGNSESSDAALLLPGSSGAQINLPLPATSHGSHASNQHIHSDLSLGATSYLTGDSLNTLPADSRDGVLSLLGGVTPAPDRADNSETAPGNGISSPFSLLSSGSTRSSRQIALEPSKTKRLVDTFFRDVHPYWPILHEPTFSVEKSTPILLSSMLVVASLAENGDDHFSMAPAVLNAVMESQRVCNERRIPLETLQAMLLCLVYCITAPNRDEMAFRTLRLNALFISTLRYQQFFGGLEYLGEQQNETEEADGSATWIRQESCNRLAYASLRVDAYLSIILDQPPSVRYFEFTIPLPKPASLWSARCDEERSRLQWNTPAGRERALFCNIIRDGLEASSEKRRSYPLNGVDYHLGLCALQVGVWDAAREAQSFASDELSTKLYPGDPIVVWRSHLDFWRKTMERNGCFGAGEGGGCSSAEQLLSPCTIVLWHASFLKMHAPISLLMASADLGKNRLFSAVPGFPRVDIGARIRAWMGVRCSRLSLWNAAQIARVVVKSLGPRPQLQLPLASYGIFMAAVVVVSYTFYSSSCGGCAVENMPTPSDLLTLPVVDLFAQAEDDPAVQAWVDTCGGYAVWKPCAATRIPICRCKFDDLVEWFQSVLGPMDKKLCDSFMAFTDKLKLG